MRREQSKRILSYYNLLTQMRVKGGNDYITYVKDLLKGCVKEKKTFVDYELKLVTDFEKFNNLMYRKEKEVQLVRWRPDMHGTGSVKRTNLCTISKSRE